MHVKKCVFYTKKISEKMKKFQSWSCPTYLTKNRTKIRCKKIKKSGIDLFCNRTRENINEKVESTCS